MEKNKKMGATSILLLISLGVFSILINSKRPMNLFKQKKDDQGDEATLHASVTPPEEPEYVLKLLSMNFTHPDLPLCGAVDWTGSHDDECDIRPIQNGLSWCQTHERLIENYPLSP